MYNKIYELLYNHYTNHQENFIFINKNGLLKTTPRNTIKSVFLYGCLIPLLRFDFKSFYILLFFDIIALLISAFILFYNSLFYTLIINIGWDIIFGFLNILYKTLSFLNPFHYLHLSIIEDTAIDMVDIADSYNNIIISYTKLKGIMSKHGNINNWWQHSDIIKLSIAQILLIIIIPFGVMRTLTSQFFHHFYIKRILKSGFIPLTTDTLNYVEHKKWFIHPDKINKQQQ